MQCGGSKNATLPVLASALAVSGAVELQNVPRLHDVDTMLELLVSLGMQATQTAADIWILQPPEQMSLHADYRLVSRMRAGICVLGPLLSRFGGAVVALPGGCRIGHRPVDLHLRGLAALGAEIEIREGYIHARAAGGLRGAELKLSGPAGPTVTGTCNLLVACSLARGRSILHGAAREPEVEELARFLAAAGAQISGAGTSTIEISGVDELRPVCHRLPADRIEAATLAIAALITGGKVTIQHAPVQHMQSVLNLLSDCGGQLSQTDTGLQVCSADRLNSTSIVTQPYPGIPTDLQAQLMALMCLAEGTSHVTETIFPERFQHVPELIRLGAQIQRHGSTAIVDGVPELSGAPLLATDLRASAALVLAGLAARGTTEVHRISHLDRGYQQFDLKLRSLGARIDREGSTGEI